MIWYFGFFFLRLHNDLDEGSQQRHETLLALNKLLEIVQRPDTPVAGMTEGTEAFWVAAFATPMTASSVLSRSKSRISQTTPLSALQMTF